ncbi:MAG: glycosyltransferase [Acidobacteria bacterium]|nr:glycosyltransferase [Acidobacteriota bacterium]
MRVALVHDWLTGMRGGEKALERLCEVFPDAELFTLLHVPGSVSPLIEGRRVHTAFTQHLPFVRRAYRHYLPVFPSAIERLDLAGFDFVVSCSHCVAKSVKVPAGVPHLCYCLTPMRYAWDQFDAYFGPEKVGRVGSAVLRPVMTWMARWDQATAHRPSRYLAISQYVARRIGLYYNRQAGVVYPPVDTDYFTPGASAPGPTFVIVSALVPYKRLEVAIDAAHRAGASLDIIGDGPERARLEARAAKGPGVRLLGRLDDATVRERYRTAAAILLPGEEDFGIVPVEAQATGRPVVALGRGGATETVVHGETGLLVADDSVEAWADALADVSRRTWDQGRIRAHAERFSHARFRADFRHAVDEVLAAPGGARW